MQKFCRDTLKRQLELWRDRMDLSFSSELVPDICENALSYIMKFDTRQTYSKSFNVKSSL